MKKNDENGDVVPNSAFKRWKEIIKRKMAEVKLSFILMVFGIIVLVSLGTVATLIAQYTNLQAITILSITITTGGIALLLGFVLLFVGFYLYDRNQ
jgi:sterol desaturase/sphingolipid hydroxylase (fatty acid hydroxylase superfamily)